MKFYVYFDAYGHARQIITEHQLNETFHGDTHEILIAMCQGQPGAAGDHCNGHVGTLTFDSEEDLQDYIAGLGEEIEGFYGCRWDSRPYNF